MKALSIRQPWAWAIISALKDIENRSWPIHYRGDILIHAAKTCTQKAYFEAKEFCQGMGAVNKRINLSTSRSNHRHCHNS